MSLRVVIVEDEPEYASELERLLSREDHQVIATFGSALLLLESVKQAIRRNCFEWDLVLMDLGVGDLNGIEAARRLKDIAPEMPVVIFTLFESPASIVRAIRPGLGGRLLRETSTHQLLAHLRAITVSYPSASRGATERYQVVGLRPSAMGLLAGIARRKQD